MTLIVNGSSYTSPQTTLTVPQLLTELGRTVGTVLVERNGIALFPRELPDTPLTDGDRLELIEIAAGG